MLQYLSSAAVVIGALRVNSLHAGYFCMLLLSSADFFIFFFKIVFQEHYQSVKRFRSRSGPTFCRS